MKKLLKTLPLITIFALSACGDKALPKSITQEDWKTSKQFVKLSTGIKMAYVEMGDPNGEVVVLQHGMTDNSRSWSLAAPYFAEAGYHVYLPDLRGQGLSSETDGFYTTYTYATDLKAFCDKVGIKKANFFGHSLGSYTVQTFMLMFPEMCEKVGLVSSCVLAGLQNSRLKAAYNYYIAPLPEDGHPSDEFMDIWYDCQPQEDEIRPVWNTFISNLKKEAQCLSKKSWTNIIFGLLASNAEDIYSRYDTNIPVLVLHGDDDGMCSNDYQPDLLSTLSVPANRYKNYVGVGHNIQFEAPKQSSKDMLDFLKNGCLAD